MGAVKWSGVMNEVTCQVGCVLGGSIEQGRRRVVAVVDI